MNTGGFQAAKIARLQALGLREEDFVETFCRSSGPGGQNVNKVSTAVLLRHEPTGASVSVQDTRSQSMNRQIAWQRLMDLIEKGRDNERAAKKHEREKKRRQNAKRPWGVKQRILDNKKRRGVVKKMRGRPVD